jgi:hypothetical protein
MLVRIPQHRVLVAQALLDKDLQVAMVNMDQHHLIQVEAAVEVLVQ